MSHLHLIVNIGLCESVRDMGRLGDREYSQLPNSYQVDGHVLIKYM